MKSFGLWASCLACFAWTSCTLLLGQAEGPETLAESGAYALIIDGVPRDVEWITPGSFANAVEDIPDLSRLSAIVAFRVVHVLKGDADQKRALPEINLSRLLHALTPGKIKNRFWKDPVQSSGHIKDRWFRVAVEDPYETFGINSWDPPEPGTYRLYFDAQQEHADTYRMLKSERVL